MIYDVTPLLNSDKVIYDIYTEKEYYVLSINKHQATLRPVGTSKKKYFSLPNFYERFTIDKMKIRALKLKQILGDDDEG
jgi:hypothetical protein